MPPDALKAYKELKHLYLISKPIVDYPRKDQPYSLIVNAATRNDVNDGGLGAFLTHLWTFHNNLMLFHYQTNSHNNLKHHNNRLQRNNLGSK